MEPRLKLKLYDEWRPAQNPGGPPTYVRGNGPNPGALQFSIARRRDGVVQNAAENVLIGICEKITANVQDRAEVSRSSGKCAFGVFGTLTVKGTSPAYMQAWVVSNRLDFILITHICNSPPDTQEIKEANEIALMTGCS
jgi:hypothetical protein